MHRQTTPASSRRAAALTTLFALAVVCLPACSDPGATTCDEYAAQSRSDRLATEKSLLEAHDLEPKAMGNALGISQAIDSYCGLTGIKDKEAAKKNGGNPLDKAVDWSAKRW
jgi:hypothetical protein